MIKFGVQAALVCLLTYCPVQQMAAQTNIPLSGVVSIQNSKRTTGTRQYVAFANVKASCCASPDVTDQEGRFGLVFADLPNGTRVRLTIAKPDWEVVNKHELTEGAVLGRIEPLKVYMCKSGEYALRVAEYYDFAFNAYTEGYKEQIKTLNHRIAGLTKALEAGKVTEETLRKVREERDLLDEQYKEAINGANKLAERFALINLDDESDLFATALDTFNKGFIKVAIALLEGVDLEKRLETNNANLEKGTEIIRNTQARMAESRGQMDKDIRAAVLLAQIYKTQFLEEKAETYYGLALRYDTANIDLIHEFAEYLSDVHRYAKSEKLLNQILNMPKATNYDKAFAYDVLAAVYVQLGSFRKALGAFERCRDLWAILYHSDPENTQYVVRYGLANLQLGRLHQMEGNLDSAKVLVERGFKLIEPLEADLETYRMEISMSYNFLSEVYSAKGDYRQAIEIAQKARAFFKTGDGANANESLSLALNEVQTGQMYLSIDNPDSAKIFCLNAIKRFDALDESLKRNSGAILIFGFAMVQAANALEKIGAMQDALELFHRGVRLFGDLYRDDPEGIFAKMGLAAVYEDLAQMYETLQQADSVLHYRKESLRFFEQLEVSMTTNADLHNSTGSTYIWLGDYYQSASKFDSAKYYYEKYLKLNSLLHVMDKASVQIWSNLAFAHERLGNWHYYFQNQVDSARYHYEEQNHLTRRMYAADPANEQYIRSLSLIMDRESNWLYWQGKVDSALACYQGNVSFCAKHAQVFPHSALIKQTLGAAYERLGSFHQGMENLDSALHYFNLEAAVFRAALASDSLNEVYQTSLAIACEKLGDTYKFQTSLDSAFAAYRQEINLLEPLARRLPDDLIRYKGLGIGYSRLGEVYQMKGILDSGLLFVQKGMWIYEILAAHFPKQEEFQSLLAAGYSNLSYAFTGENLPDSAYHYAVKSQQLHERLYLGRPQNNDYAYGLGYSNGLIAWALCNFGRSTESLPFFEKAILVIKSLFQQTNNDWYRNSYENYGAQIEQIKRPSQRHYDHLCHIYYRKTQTADPQAKARLGREALSYLEQELKNTPKDSALQVAYGNEFGNFAFDLLFARQFAEAEAAAQRGLQWNPGAEWIHSNLATALLFQGKFEKAKEIYLKYDGQKLNGWQPWKQVFLHDFRLLERAGITHPDVDAIRKLLLTQK